MHRSVDITKIRTDGGTQARAGLCPSTVEKYLEAMNAGAEFPLPVVYFDGKSVWLAEGFHRLAATRQRGHSAMVVEWREGSIDDARFYAASCNTRHGKPREKGDVEQAIRVLLTTKQGQRWAEDGNKGKQDIAAYVECSVRHVYTVMGKPLNSSEDENPQTFREDGETANGIAPTQSVISSGGKPRDEKKREAVREYIAAHPDAKVKEIAAALKCSNSLITEVRTGLGLAKKRAPSSKPRKRRTKKAADGDAAPRPRASASEPNRRACLDRESRDLLEIVERRPSVLRGEAKTAFAYELIRLGEEMLRA